MLLFAIVENGFLNHLSPPISSAMINNKVFLLSRLQGFVLIAAGLLFAASTFFWKDGEYTSTGATIMMFAMLAWIATFRILFDTGRNSLPIYSELGFWIASWGALSGLSFAWVGAFSEMFGISHSKYIETFAGFPVATGFLLFWSGPLFPVSVLVMGIIFGIRKLIPWHTAVLFCLGGILFPLSRIPRILWVAHMADLFLLLPLLYLGVQKLRRGNQP